MIFHDESGSLFDDELRPMYRATDPPDAVPRRDKRPNALRFTTKYTPNKDGCWIWNGAAGSHGYGSFCLAGAPRGANVVLAHRYSFELHVGPIPAGLQIDHLCRVRMCVNPAHLEAVPPIVNKLRGMSILAINDRKTHCKWGHEFTPENTALIHRPGKPVGRHCKTCHKLRKQGRHPLQMMRAAA